VYWYETDCAHHKHSRIFSVRYCGHRLCPACSKRRSIKDIKHIGGGLSKYSKDNNLFPYLLTLTLKNTPKLPDPKLLAQFRKYFFRLSYLKTIGYVGAYWALETKRGSGSGLWHVHFHIIFFTNAPLPTYFDQSGVEKVDLSIATKITDCWTTATGGLGRVTDFRHFDGNYAEVLKYVSKGLADLPDKEFSELITWMKGVRFKGFVGSLYRNKELRLAMDAADDIDSEEDLEKIVCPICGCTKTIKKTATWSYRESKYFVISAAENRIDSS
jgi:hypothetical protein